MFNNPTSDLECLAQAEVERGYMLFMEERPNVVLPHSESAELIKTVVTRY